MTNDADNRLLPPSWLAERWGTTVGHLANQRSKGEGVPYVKLGRSVRYRLRDVLAHEAANTVRPIPSADAAA